MDHDFYLYSMCVYPAGGGVRSGRESTDRCRCSLSPAIHGLVHIKCVQ